MGLYNNYSVIVILSLIIVSAIILSIFSYNYFAKTTEQIQELIINDLKLNTEIETYSISNILSNAISSVTSNLMIIAGSPSIVEGNISKIQPLLDIAQNSTSNLTNGYYLLNKDGIVITYNDIDKGIFPNYKGVNLSHRDYFQIPKQNKTLYISTVINSNDAVPRMYISIPVFKNKQAGAVVVGTEKNQTASSFNGVIVASIAAKSFGTFLENQIHPKFNGNIGFIDRNGTILYTQNQTFIGKSFFGNEFQSFLYTALKEKKGEFNHMINNSLHLQKGTYGFNFRNTTTTIAFQAVMTSNGSGGVNNNNNRIGTLFIVTLHTFENNIINLINTQRLINFFIILVIAAISSAGAFMALRWNKILQKIVDQKTLELKTTVQKVQKSNEELVLTKKSLEEANCQLIETNEKLKKANEGLELHDKMQQEFINVAAHELRTPIQAIAGNLELIELIHIPSLLQQSSQDKMNSDKELESLLKDKEQFQEFKKELASIYRNSQRLEKLVNNILDVTRIESNRLKLNKEYFNLNEKIRNVIDDIRNKKDYSEKKVKNINIIFQSPKDPITIYADKIRMFEVISNLIENAIKFSENEPINISVKLLQNNAEGDEEHKDKETVGNYGAATTLPTAAVVSIKDRGKGIDKEILSQLFTKFATKSYKGTGLGLYLAKNIIDAHDGKIWAKNNKDGKGATFSFRLPLH